MQSTLCETAELRWTWHLCKPTFLPSNTRWCHKGFLCQGVFKRWMLITLYESKVPHYSFREALKKSSNLGFWLILGPPSGHFGFFDPKFLKPEIVLDPTFCLETNFFFDHALLFGPKLGLEPNYTQLEFQVWLFQPSLFKQYSYNLSLTCVSSAHYHPFPLQTWHFPLSWWPTPVQFLSL